MLSSCKFHKISLISEADLLRRNVERYSPQVDFCVTFDARKYEENTCKHAIAEFHLQRRCYEQKHASIAAMKHIGHMITYIILLPRDAMHPRCTSHGPVCVCVCLSVSVSVSVTSRCSTKTAKRRITQTRPRDTAGTLVF